MRKDWWHNEYSQGDIAGKMAGGGQGVDHPTHNWFTDYIPEDSSLIDVGCCNAHTLENLLLAGKKIDYVGVDQIPEFIEYNRERHPEYRFEVSDASDLRDFEDNSFDYAYSRHVIDHLNHYSQHFVELMRVAKKEVIIVTWLGLRLNLLLDKLQWGMKDEGGSWYNQYSKQQMVEFIEHNFPGQKYKIIDNYKECGNSIITIQKEQT